MNKNRTKKAAPAVSARVLITELPRNPEEVLKRSDASALADALYKRALENGEPVSADLMRYVSEQSRGGAPSKLLEAIPVIQGAKKRTAKLHEGNQKKQQKAADDYQLYRKIAAKLISENPHLSHATKFKLAQKVKAHLARQNSLVSVKTVLRALKK